MNANLAIVACVSFAVVVVTAVLLVREPEAKTGTTPSASRKELDDVRGRIASVEESQASILTQLEAVGRKLDELATRSKNAAEGGSIGTGGKDDDAGSGAGHTDDSATLAKAEDDAKDAADAAREEQLDEALAALFDPDIHRGREQEIWNDLRKAGLLDDAIAAFKKKVEENPDSADAHADLGGAYIQKIFDVSDIEKGLWSSRANSQYDKALAIDDHHWDARLSKAINYSFNPPIMGLQPKAIEQFEILRTQQETQEPRAGFDQTYLYLGNLYSNNSKPQKAAEVYRRGHELFPQNEELTRKAETVETTPEE